MRLAYGWTPEKAIDRTVARPRNGTGVVYCAEQTSTGLRYVGVTTHYLADRWAQHLANAPASRSPLARAICADPAFDLRTLEEAASSELADRERHWIATLGTLAPRGLNANRGGALGGRRGTGFFAKADAIVARDGVCLNTARRWVREGRAGGAARCYSSHGATGSRLFRYWRPTWPR